MNKLTKIVDNNKRQLTCTTKYYDGKTLMYKHYKNPTYERWSEYDKQNTYSKDSNGQEEWKKYNQKGNLIYNKDSEGIIEVREFKNNNITYEKIANSNICHAIWRDYDIKNNLIHEKKSYKNKLDPEENSEFERWSEYDNTNDLIYEKTSDGREWWSEYHPDNPKKKKLVDRKDIKPFVFKIK